MWKKKNFLEDNVEGNIHDTGLGKNFLNRTEKELTTMLKLRAIHQKTF